MRKFILIILFIMCSCEKKSLIYHNEIDNIQTINGRIHFNNKPFTGEIIHHKEHFETVFSLPTYGELYSKINYTKGLKDGETIIYHPTKRVKRKEMFKNNMRILKTIEFKDEEYSPIDKEIDFSNETIKIYPDISHGDTIIINFKNGISDLKNLSKYPISFELIEDYVNGDYIRINNNGGWINNVRVELLENYEKIK